MIDNSEDKYEAINFLKKYNSKMKLIDPVGDLLYAPIHIFADDVKRLKQLGLKPETCLGVDCYFLLDSKIAWVSVFPIIKGFNDCDMPCQTTYQPHADRIRRYDFISRTEATPIYKAPFEKVLIRIKEWFEQQRQLPRKRTVVYDYDLYKSVL